MSCGTYSKHLGTVGALGLVGSLLLGACGTPSDPSHIVSLKNTTRDQNRENASAPSLVVTDQTSNGFSVMVTSVSLPEGSADTSSGGRVVSGGYVAVASDVAGRPATILGTKRIPEKTSGAVAITLADKLTTGTYFFLLYATNARPTSVGTPMRSKAAMVVIA